MKRERYEHKGTIVPKFYHGWVTGAVAINITKHGSGRVMVELWSIVTSFESEHR